MKIIIALSIVELAAGVFLGDVILGGFGFCGLAFAAFNGAINRDSNPAFQA